MLSSKSLKENSTFLLKWEDGSTMQSFPKSLRKPFHRYDRDVLAHQMSFDSILNTTQYIEDAEKRRKYKWKYILNLHALLKQQRYSTGSIENALWSNNEHRISLHHFVMSMVSEFHFDNLLNCDQQLRNLYCSFEGARKDSVDWRDIVSTYNILTYFRMVRDRPVDLLLILFDLYTIGDKYNAETQHKENYLLIHARNIIRRLFLIPCIYDREVSKIDDLLYDMMMTLDQQGDRITHRQFELLLRSYDEHLLLSWSRIAWDRLPTDMRLTVVDESQMYHFRVADRLLMRHKENQAVVMHTRTLLTKVCKEWKLVVLREAGIRNYIVKRMYRKRGRFFVFWRSLTQRVGVRRRRRMLAEVIGNYAIKARCFARIKLFNYNTVRLRLLVGDMGMTPKFQKLGGSHLREFHRINSLKTYYHRWWNSCVEMINHEVAAEQNYKRHLRPIFLSWRHYAHEETMLRRHEEMVRENKLHFERMMQDAEDAANELKHLEEERLRKRQEEEEKQRQLEKERRFIEARQRVQAEKEADRRLLLETQREERQRRVKKDMKKMKKEYNKKWEKKSLDMIQKTKARIDAYVGNKDNKLAIEMKYEQLDRIFHAPPTPETAERERILSSVKNIMFLHIEAKLRRDMKRIEDLIPLFDKESKGYLTYVEFREMLITIGANLNPSQIKAVIKGVDEDGDGYISVTELMQSMQETSIMGVPGSPWRMYIDPIENVMCYHNFVTEEKIYDYQMKKKKLREITLANIYGEADHATILQIQKEKKEDWDLMVKTYMVKRIQYLYRLKKARKYRSDHIWKVAQKIAKERTTLQKRCVKFIERQFVGFTTREKFKKQLKLTFEKVWDVESGNIFWYNHCTGESTWSIPRLLLRYGDTTDPSPWIPMPVSVPTTEKSNNLVLFGEKVDLDEPIYDINGEVFTPDPNAESDELKEYMETHAADYSMKGGLTGEQVEIKITPFDQGFSQSEDPSEKENEIILTPQKSESKDNMKAEDEVDLNLPSLSNDLGLSTHNEKVDEEIVMHYWHVHARRDLPRKPDGLIICCYCDQQIAVRCCTDCGVDDLSNLQTSRSRPSTTRASTARTMSADSFRTSGTAETRKSVRSSNQNRGLNYCVSCHIATHSNPMGFLFNTKIRKDHYADPDYLQKIEFFNHHWTLTKPLRCQLCRSGKLLAGVHCNTCELNLCRNCSHRIHEHSSRIRHFYYDI